MKGEVVEKVRRFLADNLRGHTVDDEADIFASGLVNSLFAMRLVLFVEQAFSIVVETEDLELDNFRTIAAITRLIDRKQQTEASGHADRVAVS